MQDFNELKKYLLGILKYLIPLLIIVFLFGYLIDPFNVMHPFNIRENGIEPNKNYIKMTYLINNPNKFDSLLFGSSRVGSIHVENIDNEKCYNMTYPIGIPNDHLNNIKTLIDCNAKIKKIYIGVDHLSYTSFPSNKYKQPSKVQYEYLKNNPLEFIKLYFNPSTIFQSIKSMSCFSNESGNDIFYNYGWVYDYNIASDFNGLGDPALSGNDNLENTLNDLRNIKRICDDNSIELVIFTNPIYYVTYEAIEKDDLCYFLKELSKITKFYNFIGINDITKNYKNYFDTSHYQAEIGDIIIKTICNNYVDETLYNQGFGMLIDESNINELIELLRNNDIEFNNTRNNN